jgi:hypothetical protein
MKLFCAFSQRQYICAYHALHEQQHSSNDSTGSSTSHREAGKTIKNIPSCY